MIRVLIVDDDEAKASRVREVVTRVVAPPEVVVEVVKNAHDAGQLMFKSQFDLLILDLNIPLRDGDEARRDGGLALLQQLTRRREWLVPGHVLGLTAFDELAASAAATFKRDLWHVVTYDPATNEWADSVGRQVLHVVQEKAPRVTGYRTDLVVLTALYRVELESVLALPGGWVREEVPNDHTLYHRGTFEGDRGPLSVIAAACSEMGMAAAAALAMKAIATFRPKVIAMCGIAAGVQGQFGDILVADQSWDYGSGKRKDGIDGASEFLPAPSYIPLDQVLRAKVNIFAMERQVLRRIASEWAGAQPGSELDVRIGPLASGASVLQSRPAIDEIVAHNRKVVGVEMETFGVFMAARECSAPRPAAMSVKSICDFADTRKNDDYQRYAAFTSARYLYEFALRELADGPKAALKGGVAPG